MKKHYLLVVFSIVFTLTFLSCSDDEKEEYVPIPTVTVDLTKVPYPKLSDYKFFDGEIKNQIPAQNVLPYEPISSLFSDYAHKKRFVWMPVGTKATFNTDNTALELPVGAVLIKTFYYENVQNTTPIGSTRIVETRLMIRKSNGWIFANYVWNTEQTEAYFDLAGSNTEIIWKDENNEVKNVNYRIPTDVQCFVCHKSQTLVNDILVASTILPIGIKPQNLNFNYNYGNETKNQLTKWVEQGFLENNFDLPSAENSTVNYNDTSKSLAVRARSYLDINCAHCHTQKGHCYYRPMLFPFSETANNNTNMGVCVNTGDVFDPGLELIVNPGNPNRSMLFHRMNTDDEGFRMPLHGRTIIHNEGVALIEQWINSLQSCP